MKNKILTPILLSAGLVTVFALQPVAATEICPSQNGYQSNGYVQVKGGRHHSRGDHHRRGGHHQRSRGHRGDNHNNNAWYFVDGLLRQIENHHRNGRHQSNEQHHRSSNHY